MQYLSDIEKIQIIAKNSEGLSVRKIAKSMNINKNTVSLWIKRYKIEHNVNRKKRCTH
jgi:transposase